MCRIPAGGLGLGLQPHLHLTLMAVAKREGHQGFLGEPTLAIERQELRRERGELHALAHMEDGHAEPLGHLVLGLALIDQGGEGLELVGRVHRGPHDVFDQRELGSVLGVLHDAADLGVGLDRTLAARS